MIGMPRGRQVAAISSIRSGPKCSFLPSNTTIATGVSNARSRSSRVSISTI